ncbi:MAG: DNA polymerase III subunit delta [Candidatus Saccharibacteria bacterium]
MITLLLGENSFEIERALRQITADFNGVVERIDGSTLQLAQLPDLLMGVSLFATARTVIIRDLGSNKAIWPVLGDWLPRISDDIHLVLVESKPDKRTTAFKALKNQATVHEFQPWTDRDTLVAERWVNDESKKLGIDMDKSSVHALVRWVGIDQWQLFHALEKLALVDIASVDVIKNIIEPNPIENVFNLFDTALRGDVNDLRQMLKILEQSEDPYRLFALLSSQVFQLAAVANATNDDNIAKDFSIHPYVVSKLQPIAKKIGKSGTAKIITIFAAADDDMKLSRAEPWLLIERALIKVANI